MKNTANAIVVLGVFTVCIFGYVGYGYVDAIKQQNAIRAQQLETEKETQQTILKNTQIKLEADDKRLRDYQNCLDTYYKWYQDKISSMPAPYFGGGIWEQLFKDSREDCYRMYQK